MQDIYIREATEEDIPGLVTVIHAAFEEYRGFLDPPSGAHDETIETVQRKLMSARAGVALVNQQIVGCVICEPRADHLYLGRLAVLPSHRRYGIGQMLIAWVEAHARDLGYARVRLAVRLALQDNLTYFQYLGYRVLDHANHPGYSQPTFANLEKDLGQYHA
ncbi:MAG: GNAT family N-acetyltransferase [Chloroflexi bacterium]|nr:GNAT family N-acetyltransferase [Chloroflexota bacterium]